MYVRPQKHARKQRGKSSQARVWKQETVEPEGGCGHSEVQEGGQGDRKKSSRQGHIRNTMSKESGLI